MTKTSVRKSTCWLCGGTYNDSWIVTDVNGRTRYVSCSWRSAVDYALQLNQPGTGVQVHQREKVSNP